MASSVGDETNVESRAHGLTQTIMDTIMNATMDTSMALNEEQGNALRAKIITMVSLFAISMAVGIAPMLISVKFGWFTQSDGEIRSSKLVMGLLSFGGGVLFATTFMHLLPEVAENIKELQGKKRIH